MRFLFKTMRFCDDVQLVMRVLFPLMLNIPFSNQAKNLMLQVFLPMTGGGWNSGGACMPAVTMATRHINERKDILGGYNLSVTLLDSQCKPGVAIYAMIQALTKPPTKLMILGCGCSVASIATAEVSHLFNLTQISALSTSPTLSDRTRFPNFYRIDTPDHLLHPAFIALMKKYGWTKVATINQALEYFNSVIEDLVYRLDKANISVLSQEIYQNDPFQRVENLKKQDVRIIITASYEDKARLVLCAAYRLGLYGTKIVWITYGWYGHGFWRQNLQDVPCTVDEMDQVVEDIFLISFVYKNEAQEKGIANISASEFSTLYKMEKTYNASYDIYEYTTTLCYDHVWTAGLALHCTDEYLRATGHRKSLDQFTYEDSDINDVILSCMSNISFSGVSGGVSFENGMDAARDIKLEKIQGGDRVYLGKYSVVKEPKQFTWAPGGIKWKDGRVPRDSSYIIYEEIFIPTLLYVMMSLFAAAGIVVAVYFFVFTLKHQNQRFVKLSSPNINNILLLGCVLTYSTIFMKTTDGPLAYHLCKIQTFCFCVGFTTVFGALFSKTWRVYKIFTNKKLRKMRIQDYHLIGVVCALSGMITCIVVLWEIIGPHEVIRKYLTEQVYILDNDAEVRPFVRICYSKYDMYFSWVIYIVDGTLMAFGAFLARETRHVKVQALNDSRLIGICLYNIVILSAVGLGFTLISSDIVVTYTAISLCVIIGTTLTQALVFIPKVLAIYGHYPASVEPVGNSILSKSHQMQTTSAHMDISPHIIS